MENKEECPVCYDEHLLIKGGNCTHEVCSSCLDKIKDYNGLCPLCRENWGGYQFDEILSRDVDLVVSQTFVTRNVASLTLQRNGGDIVNAIMELIM